MRPTRTRIALAIALAFGAVSLFVPLPGPWRQISAFFACFYLPGLVFLLAAGNPARPALDVVFAPLLLSPVLVSIALVFLARAGLSLHDAAALCASTVFILTFGAVLWRREAHEAERSVTRLVLVVSTTFAALVATSYVANRFLIVRSDSWYHGCVVSDILARGMPPMEPGFPDIPIRYMWIYHAFNAAWKNLSGLSLFPALAVFNVVSAFIAPYLAARITAVFFSERRYVVAAAVIAVLGLESPTWILWPLNLARAFTGEVGGMAEVVRTVDAVHLNDSGVIDALRPFVTWMVSTPDKHITITAFSYALNLFAFAFLAARDARFGARSPARRFLCVFIPMIGALLFHVIVGAALVAAAAGSALLALAARAVRRRALLPRREIATLLAASALAIAVSAPYVRSLLGGGAGGAGLGSYIHIGWKNMLTIALPLLVLYPVSRQAVRRLTPAGLDGWMLLLWLVPLGALNAAVDLPMVNESKLVFPLFLLVAPFVARELVTWIESKRGARRAFVAGWLAVLFAVPFFLTMRGFLLDAPRTRCERSRRAVGVEEQELYHWIDEHTPVRAAIIMRSTCPLTPVHAGRRSLVPDRETITIDGYAGAKVDLYVRVHDDLFSGAPDLDADLAELAGTHNDYYLILWREDLAANAPLERRLAERSETWPLVFGNDAGVIYAIRTTLERQEGANNR